MRSVSVRSKSVLSLYQTSARGEDGGCGEKRRKTPSPAASGLRSWLLMAAESGWMQTGWMALAVTLTVTVVRLVCILERPSFLCSFVSTLGRIPCDAARFRSDQSFDERGGGGGLKGEDCTVQLRAEGDGGNRWMGDRLSASRGTTARRVSVDSCSSLVQAQRTFLFTSEWVGKREGAGETGRDGGGSSTRYATVGRSGLAGTLAARRRRRGGGGVVKPATLPIIYSTWLHRTLRST